MSSGGIGTKGYNMNNIEITEYLIDDVAWTIRNFSSDSIDFDSQELARKIANAALIVAQRGFGDCFPLDRFYECVKDGFFIDYDGTGYWVDTQGNELGKIRCDYDWLMKNQPKTAAFVMWFNK